MTFFLKPQNVLKEWVFIFLLFPKNITEICVFGFSATLAEFFRVAGLKIKFTGKSKITWSRLRSSQTGKDGSLKSCDLQRQGFQTLRREGISHFLSVPRGRSLKWKAPVSGLTWKQQSLPPWGDQVEVLVTSADKKAKGPAWPPQKKGIHTVAKIKFPLETHLESS